MEWNTEFFVVPGATAGVLEAKASTLRSADDWFIDSLGGGTSSDSGVAVNHTTALTYSAVYSAVAQISGDCARVSLDVFKRTANDDRQRQLKHPAYRLLNIKPNKLMSAFSMRQTLQQNALLYGNGYALIVRQVNGKPVSLVPLRSDLTRPEVQADGSLFYITQIGEHEQTLRAADVLHVKGLGDGIEGYSIITSARNAMGLGLAAEKHGNYTFKNQATPTVVIEHPGRLPNDKADELMRRWMQRQGGFANAGRPVLVSGGMKVSPLSMSNDDAQWLETRKFQRVEIAAWFQIPAFKIGDEVKNYNSVEAEERIYVSQTLSRWFAAWEAEVRDKLLTAPEIDAGWYCEHNSRALIQGDLRTQAEVVTSLRGAMIISQNEARKTFNLNSVPGGDSFVNPNTATEPSGGDTERAEVAPSERTMAAHSELIRLRMEQLTKTECATLKRLAGSKEPVAAIENFYTRFESKLAEALAPCIAAVDSLPGVETVAGEFQAARDYCDESQRVVAQALAECPTGLIKQGIEDAVANWIEQRPAAVAAAILKE